MLAEALRDGLMSPWPPSGTQLRAARLLALCCLASGRVARRLRPLLEHLLCTVTSRERGSWRPCLGRAAAACWHSTRAGSRGGCSTSRAGASRQQRSARAALCTSQGPPPSLPSQPTHCRPWRRLCSTPSSCTATAWRRPTGTQLRAASGRREAPRAVQRPPAVLFSSLTQAWVCSRQGACLLLPSWPALGHWPLAAPSWVEVSAAARGGGSAGAPARPRPPPRAAAPAGHRLPAARHPAAGRRRPVPPAAACRRRVRAPRPCAPGRASPGGAPPQAGR